MDYVPFLKFKVNEVGALKALPDIDKEKITPFFDLPRKDILNETSLKKIIDTAHRKFEINLQLLPCFYIDNFDIDDNVLIGGDDNYSYVINTFSDANIIPVVGIDRSLRRNRIVVEAKRNGLFHLETVALRLRAEDIASYALIEDEFVELFEELLENFTEFHLIIDNSICHNVDVDHRANQIISFISEVSVSYSFDKIIVTGSSITASIRDLIEPNKEITIERTELKIFKEVQKQYQDIIVGDYTSVSPNYSDVQIRGELMRRVTAPKLLYIFDDNVNIKRGGAIEGHPRGNKQYNDLCAILIAEPFFRGSAYSFGDKYIFEKASNIGKDATPSTIPKALINAHIRYMLNDYT